MKRFVKREDVESQVFPWGTLEWLSEPRVTGTTNMTTGLVTLKPGQGHDRHHHVGIEEVLYILKGTGIQMLELPEGRIEKEVEAGELIHIPASVYHSTINNGTGPLEILAVYQFSGPEKDMRADPNCQVIVAEDK